MTATPDLLADPVVGHTYELHADPDGLGGTRWHLMRYQHHEGRLTWLQIATRTSATPATGVWRGTALAWLRSLGYNPPMMDIILLLDDGYERLRPDTA